MPWSSSTLVLHTSLLLGTLLSGHSSSCIITSDTRGRIPSSPPPSSCPLATTSLSTWLPGRRLNPRRKLWSFTSSDSIAASPLLSHDGSVIYIGSNDDNLYALSAKNGSMLWKYSTGDWVYGRPTLSPGGDVLYFGSDDFKVYALDGGSGRKIWAFDTAGYVAAIPTLSPMGDVLYIGSYDKYFYAIRTSDGTLVWKHLVGDAISSAAALSPTGQTLYFGSNDNKTYALSAADGSLRWTFQTGDNVYAAPLLSRSGETVYVASLDHTVYALDADTGNERLRFTTGGRVWSSPVLDPVRGVVYFGSDDDHLYAINASTGGEVWSFKAGSWVQSTPIVSSDGATVFVGSADHRLYAVNAETGSMRWSILTGSDVYSSPTLSPDGLVVYVGSNDNNLYAFDARDLPTGWQRDTGLPYLLAVVVLAMAALIPGPCMLARAKRYGSTQGHHSNTAAPTSKAMLAHRLLCFSVAGMVYGLALSGPTAFVFLVLRSKMTFAHGTNYPRDWLQMERHPFFSTAIFAGIASMALLWVAFVILAASRRRASSLGQEGEDEGNASYRVLANLPAACTLFALLSSLLIAFNFVPGLYITHYPKRQVTSFTGSRPPVFLTWLVCSYPTGLVLLLLQLCLLEALLTFIEAMDGLHCQASHPWRYWRGHFSRRWVMALPSYNWGFAGYWVSTAIVMYLFNHHQGHVPPFTPLSLIGLGAGLTSYLTRLIFVCSPPTTPSADSYDWTKERVLDIVDYLSWSPLAADRDLIATWRARSRLFLRHVLEPRKLLRLVVNAWCPTVGGLRQWVGRLTGIPISSLPGCQATIKDELDWAFVTFSISSMSAVLPLIVYWLYTRFLGDARTLDIQPPYEVVIMAPNSLPTLNSTPPIHLQPSKTPSFVPLQYGDSGSSPFHHCQWEDAATSVDPGDFNICLDPGWASCLHSGSCVFPACTGLATQIQAEPSESLWFQMQLVVYAGFLLFCVWTITWEREQNLCISVAIRLNGIFVEEQEVKGKRTGQWWQKNVIAPIILVGLGVLYSACLMLDRVEERFVFFRSYVPLNDASNRKVRAMLSDPSPVLAWFCEKLHDGIYAARVVYSFSASDTPEICMVQGALFAYGCYALLASHSRVYDFLDPDTLMTAQRQQVDGSDEDVPPYMLILQSRESGVHITRSDVNEFLHRQIYRPFLLTVRSERPELLFRLFNQDEARLIENIIEQETTSPQERAARPTSPTSPPEGREPTGGSSRGPVALLAPESMVVPEE